jgi:predicted transcriptional regulator
VSAGVGQPGSRWKPWRRRISLVALVLSIVFIGWRLILNRLLATEMAAIRERNYPVTLVELDRWYPRVPVQENSALVFRKAFASLSGQFHPSFVLDDKSVAVSPQTGSQGDAGKQTMADYLSGNGEALALLHQASNIPRSRFPINLSKLSILPYSHLANVVRSAYLLQTDAANHTDDTSPELALLSVQSSFALSQSLAKEPLVRSHLARIDSQTIAVISLQHMLNRTSLTDEQLGSLATALEKADDQHGLARAFIGQRCIGIYSFERMRDTTDLTALPVGRSRPLSQRLLINAAVFLSSPQYLYDTCGFLQWDELHYLQLMDRYIQAAQMDFPERIAAAQALRQSLEQQDGLHALSHGWLRGMNGSRVIVKDATVTARLRSAQIAIAIERFRISHDHQPPTSLAELTLFGSSGVPIDPFDGQPLRYKKLDPGYVVYSVGEKVDGTGSRQDDLAFLVER